MTSDNITCQVFRALRTSCADGSVGEVQTGPTPGPPIWRLAERIVVGDAATEATRARREGTINVDFIVAVVLLK